MVGLVFMIITLLVEMTLFLIGASRVDAQVHKREEVREGPPLVCAFTAQMVRLLQGRTRDA
eukprot:5744752-Prymnesium_polylepis.2